MGLHCEAVPGKPLNHWTAPKLQPVANDVALWWYVGRGLASLLPIERLWRAIEKGPRCVHCRRSLAFDHDLTCEECGRGAIRCFSFRCWSRRHPGGVVARLTPIEPAQLALFEEAA